MTGDLDTEVRAAVECEWLAFFENAEIAHDALLIFGVVVGVDAIDRQRRVIADSEGAAAAAVAGDDGDGFDEHVAVEAEVQGFAVVDLFNIAAADTEAAWIDVESLVAVCYVDGVQ